MPKKILLIDDDPLVLKSVRNLLTSEGYELECAKSAQEAKQILASTVVDLIVCDVRMPGQDGISLIKDIKNMVQQSQKMDIPFIFITGYASEEAPIDAFKLEADDYVLKPFNNDELLASVKRAIERVASSQIQSVPILIKQLRNLIDQFQSENEKAVYENEKLRVFLGSLDRLVFLIEKKMVQEGNFEPKSRT